MTEQRRKSSKNIPAFGGIWSVRSKTGMLIERLSEDAAWNFFLTQAVGDTIELLQGDKVVAKHNREGMTR
jgi:hypothetical protein